MRGLAVALQVDPRAIERSTTSRDLATWDSMVSMNVLYWLNAEFEIDLDPSDTTKLQSVRGILDLLSAAGTLS